MRAATASNPRQPRAAVTEGSASGAPPAAPARPVLATLVRIMAVVLVGFLVIGLAMPVLPVVSQILFESAYRAGARIGIGLSSASKPERTPTKARRAAETSGRPARSLARPPQWDSQPKLLSTTQRRVSTTKPSACGSRATTLWRIPWTFDHSRQRSAANAPS